jgi:hypothetical protein
MRDGFVFVDRGGVDIMAVPMVGGLGVVMRHRMQMFDRMMVMPVLVDG